MKRMKAYWSVLLVCLITTAALFAGCGPKTVPWDDEKVLSDIMMSMSRILGMGHHEDPVTMKQAIEKAVTNNGFNYSATLKKIADQKIDKTDQNLLRFVGLMVMPAMLAEKKEMELDKLYSGEDLASVTKIMSKLELLGAQ